MGKSFERGMLRAAGVEHGHLKVDAQLIGGEARRIARLAVAILLGAVTHAHLVNNALGDGDAPVLAQALRTSRTLTHVDLQGNAFSTAGCAVLAEALRESPAVRRSCLHVCHLLCMPLCLPLRPPSHLPSLSRTYGACIRPLCVSYV